MNGPRILVYGCPNGQQVKQSVEEYIKGCSVRVCEDRADLLSFDTAASTHVVVCYVGPADEKFSDTILWELLDRYPYLTVVVVGGPKEDRIHAHTFGGVYYLPQDASASLIAFEADRAFQASWWSGLADATEPFVVVDENLRIARANEAALASFGVDVVGQPFRAALEGVTSGEMPFTHPVAEVFRTGKAASRYYRYHVGGDRTRWVNLICRPIPGLIPDHGCRAVAMLFVEVNQWASIVEAASVFHEKQTEAELYDAIVKHAQLLGFKRARLYKFSDRDGTLRGCASVGLSAANEAWFRNEFFFPIKDDQPSQATLAPGRELPVLFLKTPAEGAAGEPSEDGAEPFRYGRPGAESRLEMENVGRWIEAPLLVPVYVEEKGQAHVFKRRWGKLCVDCGAESDQLNVGDAADVALFASAAASAIAAVGRMELDRHHIQVLTHYSQRLASAQWRRPELEILPRVIDLLLKMYLEITGADVVYYRECQGNDVLRLKSTPKWRRPKPDDCDPPGRMRRNEGAIGRILEGPPYRWDFDNHARKAAEELLAQRERWSEREEAFLRRIGSKIYLPVVVHGELRGVIVAIAWNEEAFPSDLKLCVERFMHTARLWFELGELHDGREWSAHILGRLIPFLPKLAEAKSDDAFFAAVAAMLTAHDGFTWNRALVFACKGLDPVAAELVYALGGCGEEDRTKVHKSAEGIPLQDLVETRLKDPVPHGPDGKGVDHVDSLYEMCVVSPRKGEKPIVVPFGKDALDREFQQYLDEKGLAIRAVGDPKTHPLRYILERDYSGESPVHAPRCLRPSPWFDHMNREYPKMFCGKERYAFPLWRTYEHMKEPLGLVVLEMREHYMRPVEQIVPATAILLDLISDVLAFRYHERFLQGWIGGLPGFRHHAGLSGAWGPFLPNLDKLLRKVGKLALRLGQRGQKLATLVDSLKQDRGPLVHEINRVIRTQAAVEAKVSAPIKDLGRLLDGFANNWENQWQVQIVRDWEAARGVRLQCPPEILEETLQTLIQNARAASKPSSGKPEIHIRAELESSSSKNFSEIIALWVTDTGAGIPNGDAGHVFLDGFTTHAHAGGRCGEEQHKGRGLSVARAQLLMYHGDVQLVDPGPRTDPADSTRTVGATFVVRFGIKSVRREPPIAEMTGDRKNGEVVSG